MPVPILRVVRRLESLVKSPMKRLEEILQENRETSKCLVEMWSASSTQLVSPSVHFQNTRDIWGRRLKSLSGKAFEKEYFSDLLKQGESLGNHWGKRPHNFKRLLFENRKNQRQVL